MGKRGRPIAVPTERGPRHINVRIDDDVYRALAHYCVDADLTIQDFVLAAIEEKLAREKAGPERR